ncbi:MAG: hypothetical protein KGY39_02360 [Anaerolineales bacterium]|nr:hypothetical protein [Anaerolineales bacterium]MBS3752394.1 hypothetical protein [Anaerolineales bacterium]
MASPFSEGLDAGAIQVGSGQGNPWRLMHAYSMAVAGIPGSDLGCYGGSPGKRSR